MSQLNDCRFEALRGLGYTGTTNDMLLQWAQAGGAISDQLNDALLEYYLLNGASTHSINDAESEWLESLGYSGQINDMRFEYWCVDAGGIDTNMFANGSFDVDSAGWQITANIAHNPTDGDMDCTASTGADVCFQNFTLEEGETYRISAVLKAGAGGVYLVNDAFVATPVGTPHVFTAIASAVSIGIGASAVGETFSFDDAILKKIS